MCWVNKCLFSCSCSGWWMMECKERKKDGRIPHGGENLCCLEVLLRYIEMV